jgi:O-antigen ligase
MTSPIIIFVFVLAMRRSYFLSVAAALPFLWFQFRGNERRSLLLALVIISPILIGAAATFGFDAISIRLGNIAAPTEEGSAAWRLIEYYNVTQMIMERPLFGWPLGVKFINVTGIDLPEINSLMPHNSYLYVLLRGGVVGLLAWIWFLKRSVSITLGTIRSAPTAGYRVLGTWMYSAVLFTILSGFTSPVLGSRLTILIPLCLALAGLLPGGDYHSRRSLGRG